MKSSIVLHPSMGTAVVEHLRQFGDIPNRGILAGQAVDSAITDLYGKGGGVYNDLDIFRNVPRTGGEVELYERANTTANRSEVDLCKRSTYNGMVLMMEVVNTYNIKSVSRKDMLNFVNCTMGAGRMTEKLTPQLVLSGFDLNCTRVGVDLATNQLVWDKHYEEFLRSRQLRIAMMHTPWHTLLRLAKKAEELPGVYVDFEAAAQACVAVSNSQFIRQMVYDHDVSLKFGDKYLGLAQNMHHSWDPYFSFESETLYQTQSKRWVEEVLPEAECLKTVNLHQMVPRGDLGSQLQRRCDLLGKGVLFFASKVIEESRRAKSSSAKQKLSTISAHRAKAVAKPEFDYVLRNAKMFGTDYVQGQALPETADKVAEWLGKHSSFTKHLLGMSLAQQHKRMQEIGEVSREFGRQYYDGDSEAALGVLETQATAMDLDSRERMETLLMMDYQRNLQPFEVKPLPLPQPADVPPEFRGFTVTELLSSEALRREGKEMSHCVGGYAHQVRTGRSRILSIKYHNQRTSELCSTVELVDQHNPVITEPYDLRIAQNRSVSNKAPAGLNDAFVKFVTAYLSVAEVVARSGDIVEATLNAMADAAAQAKALEVARERIWQKRLELNDLETFVRAQQDLETAQAQRVEVLCTMAQLYPGEAESMRANAARENSDAGVRLVDEMMSQRQQVRDEAIARERAWQKNRNADGSGPSLVVAMPAGMPQAAAELETAAQEVEAFHTTIENAQEGQTRPQQTTSLLARLQNTWRWFWSRDQNSSMASKN